MIPPREFSLSQLRMVMIRFKSDPTHSQDELMHESQVADYIAAKVELHYTLGYNPHWLKSCLTQGMDEEQAKKEHQTSILWEVRVVRFDQQAAEAYWHTTPGLCVNDRSEGARILKGWHGERFWAHPELLNAEAEMEAQDD